MNYRNCITCLVTVALACVVLNGCATVKKIVPWGKSDGDSNATTSVEAGDASVEVSAAATPSATREDDRDTPSDSEPASDQSTTPVDLSVPRMQRDQAAIADPPTRERSTPATTGADAGASDASQTESGNSSGADEWGRAVQAAIHSRWVQPRGPNIPTDFTCDVMVKVTPFGGVDDVKVVRSCGDVALDASIETAVRDSSPLPTPNDPADFSDTLMLTFTPR